MAQQSQIHRLGSLFDFAAQPGAERPLVMHLAQLSWIEEAANVCLIGPPGTGKTHLATALAIKALRAGHRTLFATAQQWVDRLEGAQHRNSLDDELRRLVLTQPTEQHRRSAWANAGAVVPPGGDYVVTAPPRASCCRGAPRLRSAWPRSP